MMNYLPMLLEASDPFSDPSYIFEPKFNGIRLIATRFNGKVKLWTRHGNDITHRYPELWDIPVKGDVVLDCELIVLDDMGMDDFELCMSRFHSSKMKRDAHAVVFDILYYQGNDVRCHPLMKRKLLLDQVLANNSFYSKIIYVDGAGEKLFSAVQAKGMEGVVAKRKDGLYDLHGRRTSEFLKIIDWKLRSDVFISGWHKDKFGWLISVKEEDRYRSVGTVQYGVSPDQKKAFRAVARELVVKEDEKRVLIEPHFRIKVKYRNVTRKGMLHTPVFLEFMLDPASV